MKKSFFTDLKNDLINQLEENKAEQIMSFDLTNHSNIAYYAIIASGKNRKHIAAITEKLLDSLKSIHTDGVRVEGLNNCEWILIDAYGLLIHIFQTDIRTYYNLEKMWTDTELNQQSETSFIV